MSKAISVHPHRDEWMVIHDPREWVFYPGMEEPFDTNKLPIGIFLTSETTITTTTTTTTPTKIKTTPEAKR